MFVLFLSILTEVKFLSSKISSKFFSALQYGQLGTPLQTEKTETGLLDIQTFLVDLAENVGAFFFSAAKIMLGAMTEETNMYA